MSLRLAVERAAHGVVVRRRLPPPFAGARIYVSTEGGLRYLARTMAGWTRRCSGSRPGRQAGRHRVGHRRQHGAVQLRRGGHGGSGRTRARRGARHRPGRPAPTSAAGLGTRRWKSCPPRYPTSCRSPGSTSRTATARRATWRASAARWQAACGRRGLFRRSPSTGSRRRFPAPDVLKIDVEGGSWPCSPAAARCSRIPRR